ncbi:unnamed protein product [Dicrocoelium dendriticum]|nr:unnamed protein product [Dicrocoelium dendriticum]
MFLPPKRLPILMSPLSAQHFTVDAPKMGPQPKPDVLMTTADAQGLAKQERLLISPHSPSANVSCVESQLAHLSNWVQKLQKLPEDPADYPNQRCLTDLYPQTEVSNNENKMSEWTSNDKIGSRNVTAFLTKSAANPEFSCETDLDGNTIPARHRGTEMINTNIDGSKELYASRVIAPGSPVTQPILACLQVTQNELIDVKNELRSLRNLHASAMLKQKEAISEVMRKIQATIICNEKLDMSPLQAARAELNTNLSVYRRGAEEIHLWLRDLDKTIEDLRITALSKRCRVSQTEAEVLKLQLSRVSLSLLNFKDYLPNINELFRTVADAELKVIQNNKNYLESESGRIEQALDRIRNLANILCTLKRLSSIQENSVDEHIPTIRTVREPTTEERNLLMKQIQSLAPDHQARLKGIQESEEMSSIRKRILKLDATRKLEELDTIPKIPYMLSLSSEHDSDTPKCTPFHWEENEATHIESDDVLLTSLRQVYRSASTGQRQKTTHSSELNPGDNRAERGTPDEHKPTKMSSRQNRHCVWDEHSPNERPFLLRNTTNNNDFAELSETTGAEPRIKELHILRTERANHLANAQNSTNVAPNILKRKPVTTLRESPVAHPEHGLQDNRPSIRRSHVVFSRTVLVSDGTETAQYCFSSETDEDGEEDRRGDPHPNRASVTLDDLALGRTRQPWTVGRVMNRSKQYKHEYKTQFTTDFTTNQGPLEDGIHSVTNRTSDKPQTTQQHHHKCQAVRHSVRKFDESTSIPFIS